MWNFARTREHHLPLQIGETVRILQASEGKGVLSPLGPWHGGSAHPHLAAGTLLSPCPADSIPFPLLTGWYRGYSLRNRAAWVGEGLLGAWWLVLSLLGMYQALCGIARLGPLGPEAGSPPAVAFWVLMAPALPGHLPGLIHPPEGCGGGTQGVGTEHGHRHGHGHGYGHRQVGPLLSSACPVWGPARC